MVTTALIVVDMQNDFGSPEGSLYVKGAEDIVDFVNQKIEFTANNDGVVIYTQDWHPARTPHFTVDGGVWPVHCVAETHGAALLDTLFVHPAAVFVRKGVNGEDGYSAFTVRDTDGKENPTSLHGYLQKEKVDQVNVLGLATDYCVLATALDAARLGYTTAVFKEGVAAVNLKEGDDEVAFQEMEASGVKLLG